MHDYIPPSEQPSDYQPGQGENDAMSLDKASFSSADAITPNAGWNGTETPSTEVLPTDEELVKAVTPASGAIAIRETVADEQLPQQESRDGDVQKSGTEEQDKTSTEDISDMPVLLTAGGDSIKPPIVPPELAAAPFPEDPDFNSPDVRAVRYETALVTEFPESPVELPELPDPSRTYSAEEKQRAGNLLQAAIDKIWAVNGEEKIADFNGTAYCSLSVRLPNKTRPSVAVYKDFIFVGSKERADIYKNTTEGARLRTRPSQPANSEIQPGTVTQNFYAEMGSSAQSSTMDVGVEDVSRITELLNHARQRVTSVRDLMDLVGRRIETDDFLLPDEANVLEAGLAFDTEVKRQLEREGLPIDSEGTVHSVRDLLDPKYPRFNVRLTTSKSSDGNVALNIAVVSHWTAEEVRQVNPTVPVESIPPKGLILCGAVKFHNKPNGLYAELRRAEPYYLDTPMTAMRQRNTSEPRPSVPLDMQDFYWLRRALRGYLVT